MKLKELGEIVTGNTPSKKNEEFYESNDICFFKPGDLEEDYIVELNNSEEYISEKARNKARILPQDSILVTCIGTIGKVGLLLQEATCNQQINAIIPNDNIVPKYLAYAIYSKQKYLQKKANAPVVPIINKKDFSEVDVKICDKKEQQKIVEKLDTIMQIIDLKKSQLNGMDDLIKSQFVEMFGDINTNNKNWNKDSLKNHLSVSGGFAFKSTEFQKSGIPVLRIGNINTGKFRPKDLMFWKEDASLENYAIYPNDVLISLTGTVGKDDYGNVCIIGDDYPKYYLNQRNAKLNLKESINKEFISYSLKVPEIKKRLTGISRGVRQANISNKDIENLQIPIPPIELQNQFADFVKQVDKQKFVIQKSLEKSQLLFNSLMDKYFG